MKLFFHWLLWDLRRFRTMLLVWTLLVLGHAASLGWLQSNILRLTGAWFSFSLTAVPSFMLAGLMLLWLFTADPAAGTASFWKMRPPTGYAVAGSKLVIGLGFFVLLPLLLLGGAVFVASPPGLGLPSMAILFRNLFPLFLTGLAWIALGAAAAGSPLQAGVRIVLALGLLGSVMLLIGLLAASGVELPSFNQGSHPAMPWVWFLAGAGIYMAARRSRHPARRLIPLTVITPILLFTGRNALGWWDYRTDLERSVPVMDASMGPAPAVGAPLFRNLPDERNHYEVEGVSRQGKFTMLDFTLPVTGLPPGTMVSARWLNLKSTGPEGRTVSTSPGYPDIPAAGGSFSAPGAVRISSARFPSEALQPFSREACRATGTLRLVLTAPETDTLLLVSGMEQVTRFGLHRLHRSRGSSFVDRFLSIEAKHGWLATQPIPQRRGVTYALKNLRSGIRIPLTFLENSVASGFPLPLEQGSQRLDPARESTALVLDVTEGGNEFGVLEQDWEVQLSANRPYAVTDVPVVLDLLVPPVLASDTRVPAEMISAILLNAGTSSAERRRLVRYAFILTNREGKPRQQYPPLLLHQPILAALEGLLEKVPSAGLPDLLWLASENPPAEAVQMELSDGPLRRRIAALLTVEDLPALVAQPALFDYLRPELTARGLVPATPAGTAPPVRNQ